MPRILRNLSFAAVLIVAAAAAWGQAGGPFSAPSVRYWLGPTLGDTWVPADSMVAGFNPQVGTTYTIVPADIGKTVSFNNAGAIAVTVPQAGTAGFEINKCFGVLDLGAGTATLTPTTSTINLGATKAAATGVGFRVCSNGTNYLAY
jgi:hypothetical protein